MYSILGRTFFLVYLVVHGRGCRFTVGARASPLHGYCDQTIKDQSRLRRIPKRSSGGAYSTLACGMLGLVGVRIFFVQHIIMLTRQDGCLGHLLLI
jgi:hypothetical protein